MKQEAFFVSLFLLITSIALGAGWDFTDPLNDWKATGWQEFNYTGGGNPDGKLIQNNGKVTVVDPSSTANYYMMRTTDWGVPYTVQVRVKVDSVAGEGSGQYPVISSYIIGAYSTQPVLRPDGIADWPCNNIYEIDTMQFQTYTIVTQVDGTADVYVNDDFSAPALIVPAGATTFYPETRIEIGAPTGAVATITVDYVALGDGEILELWVDKSAVEPNGKITALWGDLKR